jgi:quercetin dioxygenase-like cupin family protein
MAIFNCANAEKLPKEIDAWRLFQGKQVEIIQLELKPAESIAVHKNSLDVVFYVVEGSGLVHHNGQILSAVTGDCIPVEKDSDRGWSNNGTKTLKLLAIKLLK